MNPQGEKRSLLLYLGRALRLLCPVCGKYRIFLPLFLTRSLRDWFTPLDGCPHCGYAYEREPGYFLVSTWGINYGVGTLLGIIIYGLLEYLFHLEILTLLLAVLTPIFLFNFFFARHSKALFIAIDHYYDPHEKNSGDDGGNLPNPLPPTRDSGGPAKPLIPPKKNSPQPLQKSPVSEIQH